MFWEKKFSSQPSLESGNNLPCTPVCKSGELPVDIWLTFGRDPPYLEHKMIWLIISSLIGHQRSSVTVLRKQNLYRVLRLKSRFYLLQPIIFNIIIHRSPLTNNQPHEQDAHFQGWHLKCGWWIGDGYNFQGQDLKCGWWRGMPRASPPTCAPLEPYHPKNVIDNDSHLFWMFFFFQILESLNGDNYFKITQKHLKVLA